MTAKRFFTGQYVLESERLLYRIFVKEDAPDYYSYAKDPEVTRHLLWEPHPSLSYTEGCIDRILAAYRRGGFFDFALIEKATGRMIGTCGMTSIHPESAGGEIGYVLAREYWHRGFATEAAATVLAFAFCELGLDLVTARFLKENVASLAVMEKLGMRFLGYLDKPLSVKGEARTVGVCLITKQAYRALLPDVRSPLRKAKKSDYPSGRLPRRFFLFL